MPCDTEVLALVQNNSLVEKALVGEKVEIILAESHFYVESGGQVSDTGTITGDGWLIEVEAMRAAGRRHDRACWRGGGR